MSDASENKLTLSHDIHSPEALPYGVLLTRALSEDLNELRAESWATAETSLEAVGKPLLRVTDRRSETALYELDGVLCQLSLSGAHVHVYAAARDVSALDRVFEDLRQRLRPPDPTSVHEVPVTFWTYSPQGPQPSWRSISVPGWDEIESNYATATRAKLEGLMRDFRPAHGGQLILWHGEAGTGKTFALRALAWEWRDWCQLHYIVDPDSFFGEHADYLMSVLMQPAYPLMVTHHDVSSFSFSRVALVSSDDDEDGEDTEKAWRVLVLEDTGELLTADARVAMGQGLSRFLNVVDGLIGQGLRVLVLVTTNEEIRKLHPAVARPGRCAANVEFGALDAEQAAAWLRAHGVEDGRPGRRTLASLYAELEGRDPADLRLVGFGE